MFSKIFTGAQSLLLLIFLATSLFAQSNTANLNGVITDENGALVVDAKIIVRGASNQKYETNSDDAGNFSFGALPFGAYKLTVEKDGFVAVQRDILLDAPTQSSDLSLATSQVSESVTIVMDNDEAAVNSTLKLPVSIRETPRSLTVIGEQRIHDQNFRQVSDILGYVPGTTQNSFRNGSYHYYSRGYRMQAEDTRLDGFSGTNGESGSFGASTFGIQEIVVLRGPASLIYGQTTTPGGFINLISKRPQAKRFTKIDVRGGGYSGNGVSLGERPTFGLDFDTTGAITKDERILYRGLFTLENTNYFTQNTLDRNRYANASVSFKLDRDGRFVLTPSVQFMRYNRPFGGGIVASPSTSLSANDGLSTVNTRDFSSSDVNLFGGRRIEKTAWAALDFRGVVNDKIRVNAAYRHISLDSDLNSFTPTATTATQIEQLRNQNIISRVQAKSLIERTYNNFNADASYEWLNTGWFRNTTQIGYYQRVLDIRTTQIAPSNTPGNATIAAQSPINIYTGQVLSPLRDTFPQIIFNPTSRDNVWNAFLQNQTSLANGRLNITLGFNYGQNKPASSFVTRITGVETMQFATRKSGIIPNAAVVFNATSQLSVYASYSTSFNPSDPTAEDAQGNRGTFAPALGKNYEVGAKYDLLNRRIGLTFALFKNQIDNALVQSDVGVVVPRTSNRFFTPAGTRSARGAEATGEFQVRSDLRVSAGVSYLDAIYKGFPSTTTALTSPIPNSIAEKSPRWTYNVYTRYDRREGYLKGLGASFGFAYQGTRLGSNGGRTFAAQDPLVLPAYTKFDTALFYNLNKNIEFAFNVDNLFNKLILINATLGSNIEIAAPRTVTFRTSYRF
ncbi:MAG: TonB-dependent receptor [Pyrinomonadaceae bacterium]|nr:TonB-dependent receptor [Pyrinomonadaceae bacterium]